MTDIYTAPLTIYDQIVAISTTITAGTSQTLPASQSYQSSELKIELNGQLLEPTIDYNYVGAGPTRTQVQYTFDLVNLDRLRYKIGD